MKNKKPILITVGIVAAIAIVSGIVYKTNYEPKLNKVTASHQKLDAQINKTQVNLTAQMTILPKIVSANEPIATDYKAAKATLDPQVAKYNKAQSKYKTNNTNVTKKIEALQTETNAITAIISQIQNKYATKMFNGDSSKYVASLTTKQSELEQLKTSLNKEVVSYNATISKKDYQQAANFKKYKPANKLKTTNTVVSPIQSLIP